MVKSSVASFLLILWATPAISAPIEACIPCHGEKGRSKKQEIPLISGMNAPYLQSSLEDYAAGRRATEVAIHRTTPLAHYGAIAEHYAKQLWVSPWQIVDQKRAARGATWNGGCERCHAQDGRSQMDDNPRLAGQRMGYLRSRIAAFRQGDKNPPQPKKMRRFIRELSEEQMEDIIHFYAFKR
uniref:Putative cytochrome subunit of sulfide dehydrogenase n=1 Tax=Magnetococcus massalia (strain MO-1) TaxID=451514 RepID=A0A1S7LND6_MAGMO|nr:putative cytochrome subunit of sulfide dehydrogenase [Candidatus Magnetococcus massalia]